MTPSVYVAAGNGWSDYTRGMVDSGTYTLRFFFEWGGGCLWAGDDDAYAEFGFGPLDAADTKLPLSAETVRRCDELAARQDTLLNRAYPPDPGAWRQAECDRFNEAARHLLETLRAELGDRFAVVNRHPVAAEDPDLDTYLADPRAFRRPVTGPASTSPDGGKEPPQGSITSRVDGA